MTTKTVERPAPPFQDASGCREKPGEWAVRRNVALMKRRIGECGRDHECEVTMRRQLADEESILSQILASRAAAGAPDRQAAHRL